LRTYDVILKKRDSGSRLLRRSRPSPVDMVGGEVPDYRMLERRRPGGLRLWFLSAQVRTVDAHFSAGGGGGGPEAGN
jgi:hypothetical protein